MPRTASRPRTVPAAEADPPPGFAPLPEAAIAAQTDPGSFQRGKTYFRGGRIFGRVRRGQTLTAGCHGSTGGPYRVVATLGTADRGSTAPGQNPVAAACDCPRGGFCKHIVALLLSWIDDPASFAERPAIADLLAGKEREELVSMIEAMLLVAPDLEDLIALPLPLPAAGSLSPGPVDEVAVRRQIDEALGPVAEDGYGRYGTGYRDGWFADYGPGHDEAKLARLVALGTASAEAGRWRDALTVFAPLVEAVGSDLDRYLDEGGEIVAALATADRLLAACLDAQAGLPDADRLARSDRERLVEVLVGLWEADVEGGGYDIAVAGPAAVARGATPEEQEEIGRRLRALIKPAKDEFSSRRTINRAAIGFLGLLAGPAGLSREQLLAEYRNAELWDEAAATLVDLGRVDEAIALAARRLPGAAALTRFADRLMASGDGRRIEQGLDVVESWLWEREGQHAHEDALSLQWLEQRYANHGRPDKSLEAARRRFKAAPSKETFDAVKVAAGRLGGPDDPWPALRNELIAALRKRSHWSTVVEIHLDEGAVAEALAACKNTERPGAADRSGDGWGFGWSGGDQETRLAAAAERDFPDEAIAIYRRLADRSIAQRQRTAYREAAGHLARVQSVLRANGRTREWDETIAALRQQHKTLRALREELDALRLG